MRKLANILLVLSIAFIISGGVSTFILGLKADRVETLNRMVEVNDVFEIFSANTTAFENTRDELYTEVLGNLYYDNMFASDGIIKAKLSNYESLVDELGKNAQTLKALCEDVYYPDGNVNNKCFNYKSIYEQVVNFFLSDIKVYNDNVKAYNDYQTANNLTFSVKEYKSKKKYIDYNEDGVFDGKEDTEVENNMSEKTEEENK